MVERLQSSPHFESPNPGLPWGQLYQHPPVSETALAQTVRRLNRPPPTPRYRRIFTDDNPSKSSSFIHPPPDRPLLCAWHTALLDRICRSVSVTTGWIRSTEP